MKLFKIGTGFTVVEVIVSKETDDLVHLKSGGVWKKNTESYGFFRTRIEAVEWGISKIEKRLAEISESIEKLEREVREFRGYLDNLKRGERK